MTGPHAIVSRAEWIEARQRLLAREKAFTRERDQLSQVRRDLPWVEVTKTYAFDTADGTRTLADLFNGRGQLIVYHFMFAPDWKAGCSHCSFWADNFDGVIVHLNQRDTSMVAVSRAPLAKLDAYKKRMGWHFNWVSSGRTDFNADFNVSFSEDEMANKKAFYNFQLQDPGETDREGVSVFAKDDDGRLFHTYSAYARGIDLINTAYNCLDLTPKGRDEGGRGPFWVRRHDEYGT